MYDDEQDELEVAPRRDDMPSPPRLRLVPITMVMLSLLLVIKLNELYIGSRQLRELYTARDAVAEEAKHEAKADAKPDEKKDPAAEPAKDAAHDTKAAEENGSEAKEAGHGKDEGKKDEAKDEGGHGGGHGGGEAKPPEEPKTFGTGKSTIKEIEALKAKNAGAKNFSQSEIDLLENLAKRREEIDAREKELDVKAKVLEATEKRINDRINEMKTLEASLSKVVAQYDEKQNAQIASLVKIYEGMKPQQAAAIFNELDLPILLEVIDKMSERKVAPVLALMDPRKAKDVTQELAAMRKAAPKKPAAGK